MRADPWYHELTQTEVGVSRVRHWSQVSGHCTVLHCTVLYCTVLYCTVLYCTVLYRWVVTAAHCLHANTRGRAVCPDTALTPDQCRWGPQQDIRETVFFHTFQNKNLFQ